MKPKIVSFDCNEAPDCVVRELAMILKEVGIYLVYNPKAIGLDGTSYIITDKKKFTIGDYLEITTDKEMTLKLIKAHKLKLTDGLDKLTRCWGRRWLKGEIVVDVDTRFVYKF